MHLLGRVLHASGQGGGLSLANAIAVPTADSECLGVMCTTGLGLGASHWLDLVLPDRVLPTAPAEKVAPPVQSVPHAQWPGGILQAG